MDSVEVVNSSSFDDVSLTECGDDVSSEEMMEGAVASAVALALALASEQALVLAPGLVNASSSFGFDGDPE